MFWFVPTWHNVESTYQIASVETWESWGFGEEDDGLGVSLYGWFWICGVRFVEMCSLAGFRLVLDMSTEST